MKAVKYLFLTLLFTLFSFAAAIAGTLFTFNYLVEPPKESDESIKQVSVLEEDSAVIDVVEKSSNSVLSIIIKSSSGNQLGAGSGFIVTEDGMVITNRHVVNNENAKYTVVTNQGEVYEADLIAKDTLLDIAFLQIKSDNEFTPLALGDSKSLKVGQRVIAIGNALGEYSNSVTYGIVSGLSRNIIAGDASGEGLEEIDNVIQTDAGINPGNSGGPLLDLNGNVIGVNVAVAADAENIGFAIPIDIVKDLINRLDETGKIDRPILGVKYQNLNEYVAEEYDLSVSEGAYVFDTESDNAVYKNSPADKAGLKTGDIITQIDDTKLDAENSLFETIQSYRIGDSINVKILRDGKEMSLKVELFEFQFDN